MPERETKELSEQLDLLSQTVIDLTKSLNELEDEHKALKKQFASFFKTYMKKMPKEDAQKFFKDYQKLSFKK